MIRDLVFERRIDFIMNVVALLWFLVLGVGLLTTSLVLDAPKFYGLFSLVIPDNIGKMPISIEINTWEIPLFPMLCIITFCDMVNHTAMAIMGSNPQSIYYTRWYNRRFNPLRWVQYAISWSFMNLVLNLVLYQGNPLALSADFGDTIVINLLGLYQEWLDRPLTSEKSKVDSEKVCLHKDLTNTQRFMNMMPFTLSCLLYFRVLCNRYALLITDAITFPAIPWQAWVTFFFLQFVELGFVMILLFSLMRWWKFRQYWVVSLASTVNSIIGKTVFTLVLAGAVWGSGSVVA